MTGLLFEIDPLPDPPEKRAKTKKTKAPELLFDFKAKHDITGNHCGESLKAKNNKDFFNKFHSIYKNYTLLEAWKTAVTNEREQVF